jgi:hypothetical protein
VARGWTAGCGSRSEEWRAIGIDRAVATPLCFPSEPTREVVHGNWVEEIRGFDLTEKASRGRWGLLQRAVNERTEAAHLGTRRRSAGRRGGVIEVA